LDIADTSRQGQHWKESIVGQAGWTATINAWFVPGNTQQKAILDALIAATPGTKLTGATALAFHGEDAGDHYSGDSYINSVSIAASTGDKVMLTINVTGTGVLTQTIA